MSTNTTTPRPPGIVSPGSAAPTMLLYGPPGGGKSVKAASAPGPVLYINADRPDALDYPRVMFGDDHILDVPYRGADHGDDLIVWAKENRDAFASVAIDPVGELYARNLASVLVRKNRQAPEQADWGEARTRTETFIKHMRALKKPLILCAHEEFSKDERTGVLTYSPIVGTRSMSPVLMGMVSIVARCSRVRAGDGQLVYEARFLPQAGYEAAMPYLKDSSRVKLGEARTDLVADWLEAQKGGAAA